MKKLCFSVVSVVVLLIATIVSNPAGAGIVPEKMARQAGAYFLSAQFGTKAINAQTVDLVYTIQNAELNVPAIYFYNSPMGGFVMVAGVDSFDPIIGYSDEGQFNPDKIAPAMLSFLNGYVQPIVAMQNSKAEATPQIQELWNQLLDERLPYFGSAKAITRLTKSKWDQDAPYNSMAPMLQGEQCVTGCVATAMSQIMYYWRYPRQGAGVKSYTPYSNPSLGTQRANFGQAVYRYDLMGNDMKEVSGQDSIDAVGLLNYHCGVAVNMDYGITATGGSGASTRQYLKYAMENYFKYKKGIVMIDRTKAPFRNNGSTPNASDTLWCDTLRNEITSGRPVFYTGADLDPNAGKDARHAFICDGYNSMNKLFRFNWGWGYMDNSCFCNVYTSKLQAYGYNFHAEHTAYLFVQPPDDSIGVSITEVEAPTMLPAYPNPATGEVHLPYQMEQSVAELSIYNIEGRLVEKRTVYGNSAEAVIDITNYPKGVYVYRLGGVARKFVVK